MSKQLIYTSAPRGLLPGSNGFCTVAMTEGLPNSWRERLESLSAYARAYPPDDPRNPVVFSHLQVNARHVLSRISEAGKEHTGRTNHLAHHVVLDDSELPLGGPAWLVSQPGFLIETWSGAARWLEPARGVPDGDSPPRLCRSWQKLTGDAGWAGVLAEAFLDSPDRPAILLYEAGQPILPLFAEAMALLPPERRWNVAFSTYFTGLLPGLVCSWRGVLRGTEEARELRRRPDVLVIDLVRADLTQDGPLIELARTGRRRGAAVKNVAVRGGRLQPAPVANASAWTAKERLDDSDSLDSLPPPPPMPPIPRRAAASLDWRVKPLVLVLLLLFAAATGGGGVWLLQRPSVSPSTEDSAGGMTQSPPIDWEKKIEKLKLELADAETQLREAERERKKLRQTIAEQTPKVERYDWLMRHLQSPHLLLLKMRDWLPNQANKPAIQMDKKKGTKSGESKKITKERLIK